MNHGSCIHFNGVQNKLCARGVAYQQFAPGIPCIKFIEKSARGGTFLEPGEVAAERKPWKYEGKPCPLYEEPSELEVQVDRAEMMAAMEKTRAALKVASAWRVRPKPVCDRSETVECPVCNGRLHLTQSSYNGHVHGACDTPGCVRWME
jgi:hypothetical protein